MAISSTTISNAFRFTTAVPNYKKSLEPLRIDELHGLIK